MSKVEDLIITIDDKPIRFHFEKDECDWSIRTQGITIMVYEVIEETIDEELGTMEDNREAEKILLDNLPLYKRAIKEFEKYLVLI